MDNTDLLIIRTPKDLPDFVTEENLAALISKWLEPWGDTYDETLAAIKYALSEEQGQGGFVLLAVAKKELMGALIMLDTGMGGYIPRHHLVYVGVSENMRGEGLGEKIVRTAIEQAKTPISLHIDKDNPATRLYERIGFKAKYIEMRTE